MEALSEAYAWIEESLVSLLFSDPADRDVSIILLLQDVQNLYNVVNDTPMRSRYPEWEFVPFDV